MEEVEGDPWTLDHLYYGARSEVEIPGPDDVRRLINEYHDLWCMTDVTPQTVGKRIFSILGIAEDATNVTWQHILRQFTRDWIRWRKLDRWARRHEIDSEGNIQDQLTAIHRLYQSTKQYLIANNSMCLRLRNNVNGAGDVLPEEELGNLNLGGQTLANLNPAKLTSWQDSFFKLRIVLAGENFRRAGRYFLTRSVTQSNLETQAFEPAIEIVDFINENTRYDDNLDAWMVHTSDASAHRRMIEYFSERPLAEAPDIEENCHLRSYEGDRYGRGAVIYDSACDMAWPYAMRAQWKAMEGRVNDIRALVHGSEFKVEKHGVVAPTSEDVCVVHLKTHFPYDTFAEAQELVQNNPMCFLQTAWYDSDYYECYDERYRITNYRLSAYMQRAFVSGPDEPGVWGRSWQRSCVPVDDCMSLLRTRDPSVSERLTKIEHHPLSLEYLCDNVLEEITESHYVVNAAGETWVPLMSLGRTQRYRMDMSTWVVLGGREERVHRRSFVVLQPYPGQRWTQVAATPEGYDLLSVSSDVADLLRTNLVDGESCLPSEVASTLTLSPTSYVRAHDLLFVPVPVENGAETKRYVRVHAGRQWRDCSTPQFDKIYDSQKFCAHDKFMLWAQKGRTLFLVHEFDTYQTTFIIIGYGGTGKSTIMIVMQKLWPVHLRGILSSNIEQKFGMSQVLNKGKARAIYCNEVSEDLQLVQEEWQTSCSGEEGSYAVKHEQPWVGVCRAHHFWVGNAFPKHWKNNNNQVSRRLCGVLMDTPIQPRDGNVMEEIDRIMGVVQRKMVLAYFDMIDQYGTIDPMSRPEKLPPAFETFYNNGKGLSNPVEKFLEDQQGITFDIHINGNHPHWGCPAVMETSAFRELYMTWRQGRSDLSRIPSVSADKYMPPLRERGIREMERMKIRVNGDAPRMTNILVGICACGVTPPEVVYV